MPVLPGTLTVTGTVIDHTWNGPEPRAGVRIRMHVQSSGYVFATSDANGQYEISGITPNRAVWMAPVLDSDYRSPCPSGVAPLLANTRVDIHVVQTRWLATTGPPPSMPITSIWFSGVIFENVSGLAQPVAGASVTLSGNELNTAATLSDARGRYLLCTVPPGTGSDTRQDLSVSHEDFKLAHRSAFAGWDYFGVDIELFRK